MGVQLEGSPIRDRARVRVRVRVRIRVRVRVSFGVQLERSPWQEWVTLGMLDFAVFDAHCTTHLHLEVLHLATQLTLRRE